MNPIPSVFVIDDEEPVGLSLAKLLRAMGYPNRIFPSATSYLESDAVGEQACLLLDLRMPGMSGIELIEELQRRGLSVPIIVMTGHTDMESMQRLEPFPLIGILEKPFSVDQLKVLLEKWRSGAWPDRAPVLNKPQNTETENPNSHAPRRQRVTKNGGIKRRIRGCLRSCRSRRACRRHAP
jgi:FixJ family two-component response regulator